MRLSLGRAHLERKDYAAALAEANAVLEIDPADKNALFLKHQSLGRAAPSSKGTPAQVQEAPAAAASAETRVAYTGRGRRGPIVTEVPGVPAGEPAPGPDGSMPLLPFALPIGAGLIGYGVARSKAAWAEQESTAPADEDPDSERIQRNRHRLKAAAISAAIGLGIVYGGPWLIGSFGPAIAKLARGSGGSLQRVAASETGAINPKSVNAAQNAVKPGIWSPGKFSDPTKNALEHWNNHKLEFPELRNSKEYVDAAWKFIRNPPPGTLVKDRLATGERVFYHPRSNTLAVKAANGVPKTMFKPSPAQHPYPTNLDYFNAQ